MIETIIVFIVIALFLGFTIKLFAPTILEIIINLPLLYIAIVRSYIDIIKKNHVKSYLISLGITTLTMLILFAVIKIPYNIIIWWPTLFIIVLYLIAQIVIYKLSHEK